MTSTGKMIAGTMIIAASVMTAKYLHRPGEAMIERPAAKAVAPKLNWQVRETAPASTFGLEPVGAGEFPTTSFAKLASAQEGSNGAGNIQPAGGPLTAGDARPPIPFALAQPSSGLMLVDDEEVDPRSVVKDYVEHTVQFGETLPQIALRYLGRREEYLSIYQANLDVLSNPAEISPGIVLKIPVR